MEKRLPIITQKIGFYASSVLVLLLASTTTTGRIVVLAQEDDVIDKIEELGKNAGLNVNAVDPSEFMPTKATLDWISGKLEGQPCKSELDAIMADANALKQTHKLTTECEPVIQNLFMQSPQGISLMNKLRKANPEKFPENDEVIKIPPQPQGSGSTKKKSSKSSSSDPTIIIAITVVTLFVGFFGYGYHKYLEDKTKREALGLNAPTKHIGVKKKKRLELKEKQKSKIGPMVSG